MSLAKIIPCCRSLCLLLAAILLLPLQAYSSDDEVMIYSEHYPPFNFYSNQSPQGISVELLQLMLEQMDAPFGVETIHFVPWPRGYQRTLNVKNSMLFSTYRTPAREELFKWVGPIASSQNGLIIRSDLNRDFSNFADLEDLRVGIIKNDIGGILLKELNIPNIHLIPLSNPDKAAKMLEHGRLDAWAYDVNVATDIQRRLGLPSLDYKVGLYLGQPGWLYFAFNPETDDSIIQNFQRPLDQAKKATNAENENLFENILRRFNYRLVE